MENETATVLAQVGTLLLALGGLVTAAAAIWRTRGQNNKDAADAWASLLAPLQEEIKQLRERLAVMDERLRVVTSERDELKAMVVERDNRIVRLEARSELLEKQVIALGGRPFDASPL